MASMDWEDKFNFLLCVLKNTGGTPNLQAVAVDRGDKQANIQYQFKAMVKASGQYTVERNRVVTVGEGSAHATPTGISKGKNFKAKKADKAITFDAQEKDGPAKPKAEESVELVVEEPVITKSTDEDDGNSNKDEKVALSTTPRIPYIAASKRGRAKEDTTGKCEDTLKPAAKKPGKAKRHNGAEEKAANEAEEAED